MGLETLSCEGRLKEPGSGQSFTIWNVLVEMTMALASQQCTVVGWVRLHQAKSCLWTEEKVLHHDTNQRLGYVAQRHSRISLDGNLPGLVRQGLGWPSVQPRCQDTVTQLLSLALTNLGFAPDFAFLSIVSCWRPPPGWLLPHVTSAPTEMQPSGSTSRARDSLLLEAGLRQRSGCSRVCLERAREGTRHWGWGGGRSPAKRATQPWKGKNKDFEMSSLTQRCSS